MDSDAEREERDEAHSRQGMLLATIGGKLGDQALVLQMHDGSLRALKEQLEQRADATEVVRLREELASMKKRMDEMEAAVARKADSNELLGLSTQLGHKAENSSLEERLKQLRQDMLAESKSKLSRAEVVQLLAAKADVSDMESSFTRVQQNTNSVRLQLESMVLAETEQRKSDAAALRQHVDADFDGHYQKIETKVDQRLVESAKLAVEGAMESLLENQSAALRDFEKTLADAVRGARQQSEEHAKQVEAALAKKLLASHKMVEVSMQKDAEARERLDSSLRSDILSQVRVISGEFHAELSRKADQSVLDALASEVERCAAELSRCAPAVEVRAWLESKVDAVHVQSSLRSATTALQSKLDAKLKAEGEAWRMALHEERARAVTDADTRQADSQRAIDLVQAASQKAIDDVERRNASAVEAATARCMDAVDTARAAMTTAVERGTLVAGQSVVEARAYADTLHAAALADTRAALKAAEQLQRSQQEADMGQMQKELEVLAGKLRSELATSQDSLLAELQSTLTQMTRETKQNTDHELKASLATLKLALQDELSGVRKEISQQVTQAAHTSRERMLEELSADRKQRAKEQAELETVQSHLEEKLRNVEHATDGQLSKLSAELEHRVASETRARRSDVHEFTAALEKCMALQTDVKAASEQQLKDGMEAMSKKLAYCVEQLQCLVEDDLEKQRKAVGKVAGDVNASVADLKSKVEVEERSRLAALKEVCRELETIEARGEAAEARATEQHERLRAAMLADADARQARTAQEVQAELDHRLRERQSEQQQMLEQLSAGVHAEVGAALHDTEERLQAKLQQEMITREEEMRGLRREQRAQLLEMMATLSAAVAEDEENRSKLHARSRPHHANGRTAEPLAELPIKTASRGVPYYGSAYP